MEYDPATDPVLAELLKTTTTDFDLDLAKEIGFRFSERPEPPFELHKERRRMRKMERNPSIREAMIQKVVESIFART